MPAIRTMRLGATIAAATFTAFALAACTDLESIPKHLRPLPPETRDLVQKKGMEEKSPILVRIFKDESVLEVWKKQKATGRFALLKTYEICAWSGELGPKKAEGDRQAPEGFYTIRPAQMNPKSSYYLSFNMGYPNEFDQSLGRTGTHLMVHGACSSAGCYSMEDAQIAEIYALARLSFEGGQRDFQVQAFPFRMTPQKMAEYRNNEHYEFWKMLKVGYDHFEVTRQVPKVDVCDRRYVFDTVPQAGMRYSPTSACPPMSVPEPIAVAVAEKQAQDQAKFAEIAAVLDSKERKVREQAEQAAATMMAQQPVEPQFDAVPAAAVAVSATPQGQAPRDVASAYAEAEKKPGIVGNLLGRFFK